MRRADISLLFDFFVTSQRIKRLLSEGMAGSGMKPDEYAVYGLLFEKAPLTASEMAGFLGMPLTTVLDYLKAMSAAGHLERLPHPHDGRAVQLRLSLRGVSAHQRAHDYFEVVHQGLMRSLSVPEGRIRLALGALDEAVQAISLAAPQPKSARVRVVRAGSGRRAEPQIRRRRRHAYR